jgi:hypothetical protein
LWEENTSGERVTLQLYLGEIVSLICESITLSSWTSKRKVGVIFSSLLYSLPFILASYEKQKLVAIGLLDQMATPSPITKWWRASLLSIAYEWVVSYGKEKNGHLFSFSEDLCLFVCFHLQSAQAICKLSEVLGESLSSYHDILLQSLMKEIPGRLWEVGGSVLELWTG